MIAEILTLIIAASASSYATAQVLQARHAKRFAGLRKEARAKIADLNCRLEGATNQVNTLQTEVHLLKNRVNFSRSNERVAGVIGKALPDAMLELCSLGDKEPRIEGLEVSGFALTQPFEEFAQTVVSAQ